MTYFEKRHRIEQQVASVCSAIEKFNRNEFGTKLNSDATYKWKKTFVKGKYNILDSIAATELKDVLEIKLCVETMLIDVENYTAALELVSHRKMIDTSEYVELRHAWILEFSEDLKISSLLTWIDPEYKRTHSSPCTSPHLKVKRGLNNHVPVTRRSVEEVLRRETEAMSRADLELWSSIAADSVIINPPWDRLVGRDACKMGLQVFFEHYQDTEAKITKVVFDDTQPNSAIAQQTFCTTNKETGQRGSDLDFVLVEIEDNKLKFWKTYFDTDQSVQHADKTANRALFGSGKQKIM
jgi:hypothetical protein